MKHKLLCTMIALSFSLLSMMLWACSKSEDVKTLLQPTGDSLPPQIIATQPAAAATEVVLGSKIAITFSEAMNSSTCHASAFKFGPEIEGKVMADASGKTFWFVPIYELKPLTAYTASVASSVEDLSGNTMKADYHWTFTTE